MRHIQIPPGWLTVATPRSSAAVAIPWYLSGGISAANCISAYQAKGAASLAASYINLANPGTYNAAPGVAPTWDTTNGWIFNGSTQYLRTGVTPGGGQTWSAVIRYSNVTGGGGTWLFGAINSTRYFGIQPIDDQGSPNVAYLTGSFLRVSPSLGAGVLGIAGNQGYRNGSADGGTITNSAGTLIELYIGAVHIGGGITAARSGYYQAFSMYNTVLSGAQMLAVSSAMAAL